MLRRRRWKHNTPAFAVKTRCRGLSLGRTPSNLKLERQFTMTRRTWWDGRIAFSPLAERYIVSYPPQIVRDKEESCPHVRRYKNGGVHATAYVLFVSVCYTQHWSL